MPDTYTTEGQQRAACQAGRHAMMRTADGFLVTLQAADSFQHYYTAEWDDALDTYEMPPVGWTATAISPCQSGVPFCRLQAHTVAQLRAERRRAA